MTTVVSTESYSGAKAIAIQTDGKIVAAGDSISDFVVVRYLTNGNIDSSFGQNGKVVTHFDFITSSVSNINSVIVQLDGKIIAGGSCYSSSNPENQNFALARYDSNGNLDLTFGVDGKVLTPMKDGAINVLALQNDGRILAGGRSTQSSLLRYLTNGSLDSSFFSLNGLINPQHYFLVQDLAIQKDGKIIVGTIGVDNNNTGDFKIVRLLSNGKYDSTFGLNGSSPSIDFYGSEDELYSVSLLTNGDILAGGSAHNVTHGTSEIAIAKYKNNGSVDSSFGLNGRVATTLGEVSVISSKVLLQKDGKIIINGDAGSPFIIARFDSNGKIDSSFGSNGKAFADFGISSDFHSAALQSDGKIIAVGMPFFSLARFKGDDDILPISLINFTSLKKEKSVLLLWQISTEINNNYFSIERSSNGINQFEEIGRVQSRGNSNQTQQYQFEDLHPLSNKNYYRLKQIDKDGHATYFKTILVEFAKYLAVTLYPNPVKDVLKLAGLNANAKTTISIIDMHGRVIMKTTISNVSTSLNINQLQAGTYLAKIETNNNTTALKFVKE